jgi:catechol 2,3-dioxygenase-like lactoylglutathione lyase family enzyme
MKITTNLFVDEIEKSLEFWVDRMGFTQTVGVPDGEKLGFVILVYEGAELMRQTLESLRKDESAFAPAAVGVGSGLFIEVADFDDVLKRLEGYPVAMPERTTFYGMREIGVRDPSGHIAIFAAPAPADPAAAA